MKKSKAIKLVLVSSLIGAEAVAFGSTARAHSPFIVESSTKVSFAGNDITRTGYRTGQDTAKSHSGPVIVARGGWGSFGHFCHAAS